MRAAISFARIEEERLDEETCEISKVGKKTMDSFSSLPCKILAMQEESVVRKIINPELVSSTFIDVTNIDNCFHIKKSMHPMMDKEDKLLVDDEYKMDKEAEILSLQDKDEACYDRIWEGFIGKELFNPSPMTIKKCLLQILRVHDMPQKINIDSKFSYGPPDKRGNIKGFLLVSFLLRFIPKALHSMKTWWPPWDRGRDWRPVSLIINLEDKVVLKSTGMIGFPKYSQIVLISFCLGVTLISFYRPAWVLLLFPSIDNYLLVTLISILSFIYLFK